MNSYTHEAHSSSMGCIHIFSIACSYLVHLSRTIMVMGMGQTDQNRVGQKCLKDFKILTPPALGLIQLSSQFKQPVNATLFFVPTHINKGGIGHMSEYSIQPINPNQLDVPKL